MWTCFFLILVKKNLTLSSFFILKITYLAYSSLMIFRTLLTIFPTAVSDCWAAINCLPSLTTFSMTSLQFTSIMPYRIIPMTLWSYNLISCILCINFKFFSILFHFHKIISSVDLHLYKNNISTYFAVVHFDCAITIRNKDTVLKATLYDPSIDLE